MIRKYHDHKLQIDTWHSEEELQNHQEENTAKQPTLSSPSRWLQNLNGHKVTHNKT